jgi:hypothetical protein
MEDLSDKAHLGADDGGQRQVAEDLDKHAAPYQHIKAKA